ncbi:MAG: carbon storage regulator CsrA [Campylobacteraceae bacterium]|nr:carbon storage regulator CsrA [Campylobacteraceae bacterium]
MLVLSRKEGEGIRLGDEIEVEIIGISKGIVRIGIKAPKEVLILRSELAKAVEKSNVAASSKLNLEALSTLSSKIKLKT